MDKKLGPYLLLFILAIVLVFVLGIRTGQRVEKNNKTINYLLSLPPTKPPLEFKTYTHKGCGLSFLYPSYLSVKTSSISALFSESDTVKLEINCGKEYPWPDVEKSKIKTVTKSFRNSKIGVKELDRYYFELTSKKNQKIFVAIHSSLFALFEQTALID